MIRIKNPIPPKLPNEYQEVEYIESKSYTYNTNYINTGIYPTNNTKIELKLNAKYNDYDNWFGSSNLFQCQLNGASKLTFRWNGTEYNYSTSLSSAKDFIIIQDKNKTYLNGNLIKTFTNANFSDTNVLRLLSAVTNWSGTVSADRDAIAKLYYCKIWESDVLVRNFVPCYRKNDNTVGLYDLVNNVFYTNAGTGTFLVGNEVNKKDISIIPTFGSGSKISVYNKDRLIHDAPGKYTQVKYLKSTGIQYIDTGVNGTAKATYEIKFNALSTQAVSYEQYFGGDNSNPTTFKIFGYSTKIVGQGSGSKEITLFRRSNAIHTVSVTDTAILVDGTSKNSYTPGAWGTLTYYIFNAHGEPTLMSSMELYYLKMYSGDVLVRDFVPCIRKSDNVAGLLDKVNNVFYTNAGTGTFLTGAVVGDI